MKKRIGVGGHFEEGETADECVCREVLEETGLTLTDYKYRGIVNFESTTSPKEGMVLYTATGFTGELRECNEGMLKWVLKEDVMKLNLWEGDRIFLKRLLESEEPFVLDLLYEGDVLVKWGFK